MDASGDRRDRRDRRGGVGVRGRTDDHGRLRADRSRAGDHRAGLPGPVDPGHRGDVAPDRRHRAGPSEVGLRPRRACTAAASSSPRSFSTTTCRTRWQATPPTTQAPSTRPTLPGSHPTPATGDGPRGSPTWRPRVAETTASGAGSRVNISQCGGFGLADGNGPRRRGRRPRRRCSHAGRPPPLPTNPTSRRRCPNSWPIWPDAGRPGRWPDRHPGPRCRCTEPRLPESADADADGVYGAQANVQDMSTTRTRCATGDSVD